MAALLHRYWQALVALLISLLLLHQNVLALVVLMVLRSLPLSLPPSLLPSPFGWIHINFCRRQALIL